MILLAIMKEKKYFIFSKLKKCHLTVTKDNIYFPIENKFCKTYSQFLVQFKLQRLKGI